MHVGEFTCPSWKEFTTDRLSPSDVAVNSTRSHLFDKDEAKNDPFAAGTNPYLGATGLPLWHLSTLLVMGSSFSSRMAPLCQN